MHHAFTSPQDLETFDSDPGNALAWAYDIVCNGNEIGGGSIRIHREDIQKRVFAIMGLAEDEAQEKFGFLLDAFKYGAPPHGGIAFGWDRIVALLAGTDSIRDVIAFPKSGGGFDPLTAAPAPITPEQRKEAGVDAPPPAQDPAGNRPPNPPRNPPQADVSGLGPVTVRPRHGRNCGNPLPDVLLSPSTSDARSAAGSGGGCSLSRPEALPEDDRVAVPRSDRYTRMTR